MKRQRLIEIESEKVSALRNNKKNNKILAPFEGIFHCFVYYYFNMPSDLIKLFFLFKQISY